MFTFNHQPLLGTLVEVRLDAADERAAELADACTVAEIERLEAIFTAFDPTSELSRWRSGALDDPGPDLATVLRAAHEWQLHSGGVFNPLAGQIAAIWRAAADASEVPDSSHLAASAASIRTPRLAVEGDRVVRTGDCADLELNAIAKGYIVDRALDVAAAVDGVRSAVVNAGGDLAHRGGGSVRVGIENPKTPFDNAPVLATVEISGQALATSGSARRGVRIGGTWFSHVIDPRTGWSVDRVRSASVVADTAMAADAIATVLSVLEPDAGIAFADDRDGVGCLIVDAAGVMWRNTRWPG